MIGAVIKEFTDKEELILNGEYDEEILMTSSAASIREVLKEIAKTKILSNEEIYKTELAGESIIKFLLKFYIDVLANGDFIEKMISKIQGIEENNKKFTGKQIRVYNIISSDFRIVYENKVEEILNSNETETNKYREILYNTYLLITDYISCMTDNYSVELYRKLKGININ